MLGDVKKFSWLEKNEKKTVSGSCENATELFQY